MKEMKTAQALAAISNEVSAAQDQIASASIQMMRASQAMSAIQFRIQALMHEVLEEPLPGDFRRNTSFGVADETRFGETASSPELSPLAHDGREIVTAAPARVVEGENGSDAQVPGTGTEIAPQSEQAVAGDVSGSTEASPANVPEKPDFYEAVLDRFAATGHGHQELAQDFGVSLGAISLCLQIARDEGDRRVAQGDLKRQDLVDGKEPAEEQPAKTAARQGKAKRNTPIGGTIEPKANEYGLPLVIVAFTDGIAQSVETSRDVRMNGPLLRILALVKDQHWYPLPDVMRASRDTSMAVFRTKMMDLRRSLKNIGLTIVEDEARGFQLRRLAADKVSEAA